MKMFTANIKDNPDMPDAHVRHDIRKIKAWKRGWDVGCWQEIGEAADYRAIGDSFKWARFSNLFRRKPTPITVNRLRWMVQDNEYVRTHGGLAGVSPNRGYTLVIIKNRFNLSLPPLAIINTHFVSGAWYGQHSHQAWRREHWLIHWKAIQDEVEQLNARGITVIVLGDWNRKKRDIPKFVPTQTWLATNGYYDHMALCPASGGLKVTKQESRMYTAFLYTDHNPLFVKVSLAA